MPEENSTDTTSQSRYISVEDAATELGVKRSSVYYYIKQLKINAHKRFPLDRRSYMTRNDLARIQAAKQAATERNH